MKLTAAIIPAALLASATALPNPMPSQPDLSTLEATTDMLTKRNPIAQIICHAKNPDLVKAIQSVCANEQMTVPSDYGINGATVGNSVAWVHTQPGCPVSWVPQQYCFSQFYDVCAHGDKTGFGLGLYGVPGQSKCQAFLTTDKHTHEYKLRQGD